MSFNLACPFDLSTDTKEGDQKHTARQATETSVGDDDDRRGPGAAQGGAGGGGGGDRRLEGAKP